MKSVGFLYCSGCSKQHRPGGQARGEELFQRDRFAVTGEVVLPDRDPCCGRTDVTSMVYKPLATVQRDPSNFAVRPLRSGVDA